MNRVIDWAFAHTRTVLLILAVVLTAGVLSYRAIPKEAAPDIPIPTIYVSVAYSGIAPEDAERLLVRPLETELQSLEGLDEMSATAAEGYANVTLEFDPGFDAEAALDDVREAVDRARPELPAGAEEPVVREVNTSLFPIVTVVLSGPIPERTLVQLARDMQDRLEAIAGVLEVDVGGDREEVVDVLIDPVTLESYGISFQDLAAQIERNNRLVAAGAIDTGAGRISLKVPGVIETLSDVMSIPVKVDGEAVVTLGDIALVRRALEDPVGFARIDGQPALSLEVKKRTGANVVETVEAVRAAFRTASADWPASIEVAFLQDQSEQIRTMLGDLENNVLTAILLVMVVIVAALGLRSSILVGLSIPGSFFAGIAVLFVAGYTLNIIVLFSLILVVGMLVDGAIVTTELADRRLAENAGPKAAFAEAARRMAWPIIASTATTLAVFLPLLFWEGVVGEFMKFLPITVLITLTASLAMALVFVPVLGGVIGRRHGGMDRQLRSLRAAESGDLRDLEGATASYVRLLGHLTRHPLATLAVSIALLAGSYAAYAVYGRGVEFFPDVEPEVAQIRITSRDALSVHEKDRLVRAVERRIDGIAGIEHAYARTYGRSEGRIAEDTIGVVQLDFTDWETRPPAAEILDEVREVTAGIPGVRIEAQAQEGGPSAGKPVVLRLEGLDGDALASATDMVRTRMDALGGFVDVTDSRAIPGVEWLLRVDRERAARAGADIALLGQAVQLVTGGLRLADYRPTDVEDEVEIRVRFPAAERNLDRLEQLRLQTSVGLVPIRNFVDLVPAEQTGRITRVDGVRVITVEADVAEGLLASDKIAELQAALGEMDLPDGVTPEFAGEAEEQTEAAAFLATAFLSALFLMVIVLVTQFNSIYQTLLVLSAIVFSTAGVLLGLLVTGRPFGVVMGGIGMIALAGIVVNNNIVLIDTFNEMRAKGYDVAESALRAGAQRLRPVVLTSLTTVLGLMPMVFGMNIDLVGRDVAFGAPSTQYWTELSSAIAGGLTVATVLTLLLTPSMLVLSERVVARARRVRDRVGAWRARRRRPA